MEDPPGTRLEPSQRNLRPRQQALANHRESSAAEPFEQQLFGGLAGPMPIGETSEASARLGGREERVGMCVCVRGDGKHAYP